MTTVWEGYSAPLNLCIDPVIDGAVDKNRFDGWQTRPWVLHPGDSVTFHPVLNSPYVGQQVQWRVRHRLNYAAGLLEDDTGAEVWTDFPDWTEPSGATPVQKCTYMDWPNLKYVPSMSMTLAYDLSQYDLHEVEIRARVYSSSSDRCSEWAYNTVRVAMQPQLTAYTAETRSDGSLSIDFETNWPRGAELHLNRAICRVNGLPVPYYGRDVAEPEGVEVVVHRTWLYEGDAWFDTAYLLTDDMRSSLTSKMGGCSLVADPDGGYRFEAGAHVDPQDVPVPSISISHVESAQAIVEIACACDHVVARAEYEVDGKLEVVELDIAGASPDWTATLDAPPLGVPITIKAACCNASGQYKLATVEVSAITAAHSILTGDGDTIVLRYNGEFSSDTDRAAEAVQTVGRKLPVSRHGVSVKRDISVKGTILFPSVFAGGDMELSALNVLDNPHDWVYRNPKGMRKKVMVRSWGIDQDTSQLGRLAEVTIAMEEVE